MEITSSGPSVGISLEAEEEKYLGLYDLSKRLGNSPNQKVN